MKLSIVSIKNLRRFTDLTVQGVPPTVRLVVLVGPNGCGKSSFFDALHTWHGWHSGKNRSWDKEYHTKIGSPHRGQLADDVTIGFHDHNPSDVKKSLYVRSAYRNSPDLNVHKLSRATSRLDRVRVQRMIDNDAAVTQNYHDLVSKGIEDLYEIGDASTTFQEYRNESIGVVRRSLLQLFPDLELNSLGNPLREGTFRFTKGNSQGFHFKNLSGGEKAAFDLILDLAVAIREFDDTVFCIDEPESHLHARLQAKLLTVLYDLVPEHSQLVLSTHSVGMIRQARDIETNAPGSVAFLDFDRDFDKQVVIEPVVPDRGFWKNVYRVALDDLGDLLAPERVVICEGEPLNAYSGTNYSHDARCYQVIFGAEFPETEFVPGGSAEEVESDRRGIAYALRSLTRGINVVRLIDRDDRSDEEIEQVIGNGAVRVLRRRNLESYLFDDEVLTALALSVSADESVLDELMEAKAKIVSESGHEAADDLKPCSGGIYNACKRILKLTRCGNNAKAFMRDTLAPLIANGMTVYADLRRDIFGHSCGIVAKNGTQDHKVATTMKEN